MKKVFRLVHDTARRLAAQFCGEAPDGWVVTFSEPTRSLEQNATMWGCLQAFSEQVEWPINGRMCKLSPEDWKDLLSAAFKQEQQRVAPGLGGGMVLLGLRTSKFSKREFSEFIEFILATAAEKDVIIHADEAPQAEV